MRNRLHSLCPYFAMFPEQFARHHIKEFSEPGDYVLDPFSGRGTTLLEALLTGRRAAATDINPVAFCISAAKADVPSLRSVLKELCELERRQQRTNRLALEQERLRLPPFFRRAFYHTTLREILFFRQVLNWRGNPMHRFLSALILGSLHGEMDKSSSYFSNQMPRTISTKPRYSLKYWRKHGLWPRKRSIFEILRSRAKLRLGGEVPPMRAKVALADARKAASVFPTLRNRVRLIVTSPPYLNVTNYEEDQWLRLWFLGYPPRPTYGRISKDDRLGRADQYWRFLAEVWSGVAPLLCRNARIVCRIGAKDVDVGAITSTLERSLRAAVPNARLEAPPLISKIRNRQTEVFRPGSRGCVIEVDYVFAT